MVLNLYETPGMVALKADSGNKELLVTYNTDILAVDDIVARVSRGGDEVTGWEIRE